MSGDSAWYNSVGKGYEEEYKRGHKEGIEEVVEACKKAWLETPARIPGGELLAIIRVLQKYGMKLSKDAP